jgi:protocatechuate 3,4-dioxygenase beta subunit
MIEGATLFGEVIGVDGQPARGLRLSYDPVADAQAPPTRELILGSGHEAVADEQGRFRFDGLPAGSGHLRLDDPGFSFSEDGPAEEESRGALDPADASLTLAPGEKRELRLRLQPTLTIRGVVLDAEGRPASEVMVQADAEGDARGHAFATTGEDGSFTLRGLSRGRYRVAATDWKEGAEGVLTQPSTTPASVVEAGAANVRLRFEAPKK